MTYEEYAALPGINATSIKAGVVSMMHMHHCMTGGGREPSSAMQIGTAAHTMIFEPEETKRLIVMPTFSGKGMRAAKAEWLAEHEDSRIIKEGEYDRACLMSQAVHRNPDASRLINTSMHEQTVTWEGGKARIDMLGDGYVSDLKTTAQIDRFGRQFFSMGIDLQMGWYCDGTETDRAYIICLESAAPFDCVVYKVPDHILERGRTQAQDIARHYRACCLCHNWPGVGGGETMMDLPVPAWVTGGDERDVSNGTMKGAEL